MKSEISELEASLLMEYIQEEVSVETTSIVKSIPVEEKYCAKVKLKDSELCTYLEFSSGKGITQVFMPLENTISASEESPLIITYLDLKKEERDFLNEFLDIENFVIQDNIKIYKNGWSLGVEVSTIE